jgi:uracil-DNA glycosylase family 4
VGHLDDIAGGLTKIPFHEESWHPGGIDHVAPEPRAASCRRCDLARQAKNVCLSGGGKGGAILVVGGSPTHHDDIAGRMLPQGVNQVLAAEISRHNKDVRHAWGVSCAAGKDPTAEQLAACRPYLSWEFDLRPPRAVLLGAVAVQAVFGHSFNPGRLRRGRGWARGVPCFFVVHPQATHNRFVRGFFKQDLEWALTSPVEVRPDGCVEVLARPSDAVGWLRAVRPEPLCFDFEYYPKNIWAPEPLTVLCLGMAQDPERPVTIPGKVLEDAAVRAALKEMMEDVRVPKLNQDVKNDRHVMWRAYGIETVGVEWDSLIASRLRDMDAPAGLTHTNWIAGFGGYKSVGQAGADDDE